MKKTIFSKTLSANDVGATGGHQGGILIPKSEGELLLFLPPLDAAVKNPDAWLECMDENGTLRRFRFVYYNNRLHDAAGTRNEYRITYMTRYFREMGAHEGDSLEIGRNEGTQYYSVRILRQPVKIIVQQEEQEYRIKITSSWSRAH